LTLALAEHRGNKAGMNKLALVIASLAAACPIAASAQTSPPPTAPNAVSEYRLRADVETLVTFGTRHTLSSYDDPQRGIGAANRWVEGLFRRFGNECGGCLEVALPEVTITGDRIPMPTRMVNVLAIQRGSERPNEVVIIAAHIDSRVSDVLDATSDAPGANDNGSGTAAVIEAARILSRQQFPTTIVYAVLSGEEQGLYGGRLLARYARAQGWTVKAVLNNDIIGGSRGSDGVTDDTNVRVFSEGPRADATDAYRASMRREGGENDSPSRNLSRWLAALAQRNASIGLNVRQVWRADRFGRGGDQLPMQEAGFPAIRIAAAIEDYDHQHQDLRTENGTRYGDTVDEMDFRYLARVTRFNIAALSALARTPASPAPTVTGAVTTDTVLRWPSVPGAARYRLYRRRTDATSWEQGMPVTAASGATIEHRLPGIRIDDWVFGVSAIAADGNESPIASAVPGGAYAPLPRPAQ
jgi:Zn-dependent M28 family amino/carboxypeptidase